MAEDRGNNSFRLPLLGAVTVPAVIAAVLATANLWKEKPPLVSARDADVPEAETRLNTAPPLHAVRARIWEDPLGAAQADYEKVAGKKKNDDSKRGADTEQAIATLRKYFRQVLVDETKSASAGATKLLLMPVMIPGGPYSDDAEQRRRMRYAVVSAMGRAGYRLGYPTRMSYVQVPLAMKFRAATLEHNLVVPVKLYRPVSGRTTAYTAVIVLWINEDRLGGDPLDSLQQVTSNMFGPLPGEPDLNSLLELSVLGPSSSDTLMQMLPPASAKKPGPGLPWVGTHPKIVNVRSTVNFYGEGSRWSFRLPGETLPRIDNLPHRGCDFVRIIGTDDDLCGKLLDELALRGVSPRSMDIVLLTERDTRYGDLLPQAFSRSVRSRISDPQAAAAGVHNIHVLRYLRGLDGRTFANSDRDQTDIDRPEGGSQYDYVRRLREEIDRIRHRERRIDKPGAEPVRAIGVVGTDVHDKVLLLQALRSYYPSAIFFTTDLDASFLHDYRYTRNLIIASHYGLTLSRPLQHDVLPFRDSYQTSTFLGALYALDFKHSSDGSEHGQELPAAFNVRRLVKDSGTAPDSTSLLFEIGRRGPYQLTHTATPRRQARLHPPSNQERARDRMGLVAGISLGATFLAWLVLMHFSSTRTALLDFLDWPYFIPHQTARRVLGLLAIAVPCVAIPPGIYLTSTLEGFEPFALSEGLSAWPGVLVTLATILFGGVKLRKYLLSPAGLIVPRPESQLPAAPPQQPQAASPGSQPQDEPLSSSGPPEVADGTPASASEPPPRASGQPRTSRDPTTTLTRWRELRLSNWALIDSAEEPTIQDLNVEFRERQRPDAVTYRVLWIAIPYAMFCLLVAPAATQNYSGIRGESFQMLVFFLRIIATGVYIMLHATAIDYATACRLAIKRIGRGTKDWPLDSVPLPGKQREYQSNADAAAIESVVVIAELSVQAARRIQSSFAVAFLLLAAQYPFFEHYALPWSICLIVSPLVVGSVFSYLEVRKEAEQAKQEIVQRVSFSPLMKGQAALFPNVGRTLELIENVRRGSFGSLAQDPLLQTLSVPIGGTGGLLAIEQLIKFVSG